MGRQPAIVAVLAGGLGRRLGGAKPTTPLAGRPLIEHVLAPARAAGLDRVVIAKHDSSLPELEEEVVVEPDLPRHPLCGLVAALGHANGLPARPDVLALACDMPFLTVSLLRHLAGLDGAVCASVDGAIQPFPLRCPAAAGPVLGSALARQLPLRSAVALLEPRTLRDVELARFGDPARLWFNVNDARGLQRAEHILAARGRATPQLGGAPARGPRRRRG